MGQKYEGVFESWEIAVVKAMVARFMAKWACLAEDDFDTLVGECLVQWLVAKETYDSSRAASERTYMAKVVHNKLTDLVRERRAEKHKILSEALSLNEEQGDGSEEDLTLLEMIDPAEIPGAPSEAASDLALARDVARVLPGLTQRQQELCRLRMDGLDMGEASKALGISRDTAYEERKRIRKLFKKEGLGDYIK